MKVVINRCYGGFGLSDKVLKECEKVGLFISDLNDKEFRSNPILINIIETIGIKDSNGPYAMLRIIDIPFNSTKEWCIVHDGMVGCECIRTLKANFKIEKLIEESQKLKQKIEENRQEMLVDEWR